MHFCLECIIIIALWFVGGILEFAFSILYVCISLHISLLFCSFSGGLILTDLKMCHRRRSLLMSYLQLELNNWKLVKLPCSREILAQ